MTTMTIACGTHASPSDGSCESVSPGAAPVAPAGLLDNVSPPEDEIEFSADHGPLPLEEAPGDDEEDNGDEFSQDDTLQASSTFSLS